MLILGQMGIFFFMMLLGALARHQGIITVQNRKAFTALVVGFTTPALILSCDISRFISHDYSYIAYGAMVMVALQLAQNVTGLIFPRLTRTPAKERGVVNMLYSCTNTALLGIPLVASLFGDEAMVYMSFFVVVDTIMLYSYGIFVMGGRENRIPLKTILKNPCLISSIALMLLIGFKLTLPEYVRGALSMVGMASPPLAMMVIGASLADLGFKETVTDMRLMLFVVLKMIAVPVILMFCLAPLLNTPALQGVALIVLSAPSGVMVAMLATLYSPAGINSASKGISATTAVSALTIPLVAVICGMGV
ncbi:MAG: AEC family transporter [Succinivibrio sp.]|jgi:predicted permease|nr:AEC family transporter [Succinivibrio sp.]